MCIYLSKDQVDIARDACQLFGSLGNPVDRIHAEYREYNKLHVLIMGVRYDSEKQQFVSDLSGRRLMMSGKMSNLRSLLNHGIPF